MRTCIVLLLASFLWACSTPHDKLEAYVGMDIQEVVAELGYPDVAFVMDDARRDFQWTLKDEGTMPAFKISPAALTSPPGQFDPDIMRKTLTPAYGGKTIAAECSYTLITQWDESKKAWIVTRYQKPASGC